ncbi:MAG TPA: hypothetical protein VIK27_07455 [Candidatus Aquilonibacter sp.]
MLRYYAIATVIVLGVAVLATAWTTGNWMRIRLAASKHPAPQQHLHLGDAGGPSPGALSGDAPWALSALPDCFAPQTETRGSVPYVRAHVPAGARALAAGARVAAGPCTIFVGRGELIVQRGADRLRVPPHAVLYRDGTSLILLRTTGFSAVLRTYTITATP